MLFNGEEVGDGTAPMTDVAVDPIDGTTLTAKGRGNAIAVIAVSERGTMFNPGPCVYMEKIAVGPDAAGSIDITRSATDNIKAVAKAKGESVRDVTAVILERDRHDDLIAEVRSTGARIRLIPDGDVAGAISTAWPEGHPKGSSPLPRSRAWGANSRADCGRATTLSASWRWRPATTSPPFSRRTTWCRATTASSRPPASPMANCCGAYTTTPAAPAPSPWS
jgi:hypothetical protein